MIELVYFVGGAAVGTIVTAIVAKWFENGQITMLEEYLINAKDRADALRRQRNEADGRALEYMAQRDIARAERAATEKMFPRRDARGRFVTKG